MSDPQRLRVLHFYSHYHPDSFGGVETAINQIVRGMAEQGVQSTVLALSPNAHPTRIEIDGHPVVRAPIQWAVSSNRFGFMAIPLLRALARDADVLHCHFPWPFGDLAVLASGVRKPFIVTYHSDIVRQRVLGALYAPLREVFLSRAAAIVATSPQYARSSKVLARHRKRVHVIPLGLDPAGPSAPPEALRQKWRERIPGRFFLFVGMLRYYKGLPYAIEALRGTDMRLVILGAGPMEAALKKQAASLPAGQVLFVGPLPDEDKFALLGACEALIMPSHLRSEAFGL